MNNIFSQTNDYQALEILNIHIYEKKCYIFDKNFNFS